jgi:pyruvate,orthophosphate dikinase
VTKNVYFFGNKKADGSAEMRDLLGGKGANLAEMTKLGIPVPAGFTITTEVCTYINSHGGKYPPGIKKEIMDALRKTEGIMGAKFGHPENPLLVSVRSGARISMPGMMDTVLNVGLNDRTVNGLAAKTNNDRFAWDAYRRFVNMYSDVVLGVKALGDEDYDPFDEILARIKKKYKVKHDTELSTEALQDTVRAFKTLVMERTGKIFPDDPMEQLRGAINAVFESWHIPRAQIYRQMNNIPEEWGTAATVQSMVFGNMGEDSATGVAFSRDPSSGENYFFGEFMINAQGEDVVAGVRTPQPINGSRKVPKGVVTMEEAMPDTYKQLVALRDKLEHHYRDMQDMEFTIQQGKLWMLQTRNGKRTASAAIKIAVDMVGEKLISKKEALNRLEPAQLDQLLHPMLDPKAEKTLIARGLAASPGAAIGRVVFSAAEAEKLTQTGDPVILVRIETSPDDIKGMHIAQGILTSRGGMTSHAAVVARGMGTCCVVGSSDITVDYKKGIFATTAGLVVKRGDFISLDGGKGEVYKGRVPKVDAQLSGDFATFMKWADEVRRLKVRTNADTPRDASVARNFGAEGIGLCRTEHMFFQDDRIIAVREMIMAESQEQRKQALAKLLPMQRQDFIGIFQAMESLPVTIRTLDPPLHEFLPHTAKEVKELAAVMKVKVAEMEKKIELLTENNPMLGHRGCRLGNTFPEITEMQARAIFEAACVVTKQGRKVLPEIMIPLVGFESELKLQKEIVQNVAEEVINSQGLKHKIKYLIGTMVELPRACLTADRIALEAQFFSFGTNDLTQTCLGISRDDASRFLPYYLKAGILLQEPFVSIDRQGVGRLMEIGVSKGRSVKKDLKCGICGEHGGDPASVEFCHSLGLDYVSCSPYRVPIARLAAAQAALKEEDKTRS